MIYLDTSALVKRYVEEEGTQGVDKLFDSAYRGISRLSHLGPQHRRGGLSPRQKGQEGRARREM